MTQDVKIDVSKMDRQVRVDSFNKELASLQEKYGLKLYAANQVLEGGEVIPIVKVMDSDPISDMEMVSESSKKYENRAKERNTAH